DPTEEQSGERVRMKMQVGVAREAGDLVREIRLGLQIGEHPIVVLFELGLVRLGRVEGIDAVDREGRWRVPGVRNLEMADKAPEDRADLAGPVEEILQISEPVALAGVVMDRMIRSGRRDTD